jgi:uncharacterized protein YggE
MGIWFARPISTIVREHFLRLHRLQACKPPIKSKEKKMRNKSILWVFASIFAVGLLIFASNARAQTDVPDTPNGNGTISIEPDIATINIGVQTEGSDAQEAVASNNQQSQSLIDALTSAGVAENDIQTSNFSIYPRQEYDVQGQPTGEITYVVSNTVSVTVRDLENIGTVLDAAVQAGANNIFGIQFDIEDREAAQQQAMTAAMANAQARAEVLAEAAGVELADILSLQTYLGGSRPIPYGSGYDMAVQEAAMSVPVSPGEMQIMVDVNVIYEIR